MFAFVQRRPVSDKTTVLLGTGGTDRGVSFLDIEARLCLWPLYVPSKLSTFMWFFTNKFDVSCQAGKFRRAFPPWG